MHRASNAPCSLGDEKSHSTFNTMALLMASESTGSAPVRWHRRSFDQGLAIYRLTAWSAFGDFLEAQVFKNRGRAEHRFIWRGQRRADWLLESSLARLFDRLKYPDGPEKTWEQRSQEHLEDFKYAARGRRGFKPTGTPRKRMVGTWTALWARHALTRLVPLAVCGCVLRVRGTRSGNFAPRRLWTRPGRCAQSKPTNRGTECG